MKATECILQRRSCRKFLDKLVTEETIRDIVELCRFAPSWKNQQIARYTVITDQDLKAQIAEHCTDLAFNAKTMARAAALAVISFRTGISGIDGDKEVAHTGMEWGMFDAGIAAQTFCLAAREYEVGTCILGVCDMEKIYELLHLPEGECVSCVVAMGYPEEWKSAPPRLSVDELLTIR